MKKDLVRLVSILFLAALLAGCGSVTPIPMMTDIGNVPTGVSTNTTVPSSTEAVEASSPTPDPCTTDQIEAAVQKIHSHMREFDDASQLASNMPRSQLSDAIASMQKIRRDAEDEESPACLADLKKYEVDHMNTVINTMVAFMGGTSKETLEQGITIARQQHDQYTLELARLLGLTVVAATEPAVVTGTPPTGTATP
jgi:PBP1b-binding outer membrane lipoprotein LpoB